MDKKEFKMHLMEEKLENVVIFAGRVSSELGMKIAKEFRTLAMKSFPEIELPGELNKSKITLFSSNEIKPVLEDTVRGRNVYVIQSTCDSRKMKLSPADNFWELKSIVDAARRASAHKVMAVMPYYGNARQDRKDESRVPISAKIVANDLSGTGVDKLITMDLHADQIQGFFNIPVDHLYASYVFLPYIKQNMNLDNLVLASPDLGGTKRIKAYASALKKDEFIVMYKSRAFDVPNQINKMKMIGENPVGKDILLLDDIADTVGTVCTAADILKDAGAQSVRAFVSHPVLSGKEHDDKAYEKLLKSSIDQLIVTDSIPLLYDSPKIKVLSIAKMFAMAIYKNETNESISKLYKF